MPATLNHAKGTPVKTQTNDEETLSVSRKGYHVWYGEEARLSPTAIPSHEHPTRRSGETIRNKEKKSK
jgi:hypothetical protein